MSKTELLDYESEFFDEWEIERELDQWIAHLDRNPVPWETTIPFNEERAAGCFHPSAIGKFFTSRQCEVYLWQQLIGPACHSPIGRFGRKRADMGTVIHGLMDYYMGTKAEHENYSYQREVRVHDPRLYIVGHVDALTAWPFKRPMVWDYKSIASTAFQKLKEPHRQYVVQLNTYMGVLQLPAAVILYVVKDSTQFYACKLRFDQKLWDRTVRILESIIARGIGDPPPIKERAHCKGCPYADDCFPKR